ncbi:MAG: hypothetical protein QOK47_562 [Actinomycetota bacterium]|nr:hypothetical protein [Actinomycetota bacterium]
MKIEPPPVRARRSMADAVKAVGQAPFRTLIGISVLIDLVSNGFDSTLGEGALFLWGILFAITVYLQLALTLAAGRPEPEASADAWIKGAFRRKCFLRYFFTGIAVVIIVVLAAFGGLIVGGVVAGGWLSLAQPAAAIERKLPIDALRRSIWLGRGALRPLAAIFTLLVALPSGLVELGSIQGWDKGLETLWMGLSALAVVLAGAGTIALTRAFVALGGEATPSLEKLADPRIK